LDARASDSLALKRVDVEYGEREPGQGFYVFRHNPDVRFPILADIRGGLGDGLSLAHADPAGSQGRDVKQVMSVGVADKFRRLVAHAAELKQCSTVTLEVILAEHVLLFEPRFKALGAEVFDALQLGQLDPDFLVHIWPVFPQTGQRLVRDLEVTVVELGKDFLVLGVGDASDAAVGRAHCDSVLYEMLTGKRAFEGHSSAELLVAVMRDDPRPLSAIRRDIPAEIRSIVARCLKKDPGARYPSGTELASELKTSRELLFPESVAALTAVRIAHEVRCARVLVPILVIALLLGAGVFWLLKRSRDANWAHEIAIPQIMQLADQENLPGAYALAVKAEKSIPDDPALAKLWPSISYQFSVESKPPGADVYRKSYVEPNAPWEFVGKTPFKNVRVPRGTLLWKFEKSGFGPIYRTTLSLIPRYSVPPGEPVESSVTLDEVDKIPSGMGACRTGKVFQDALHTRLRRYAGVAAQRLLDRSVRSYQQAVQDVR
jgi:hypothetical protein